MASVLSEVDTGAEGNDVPPMEDGAEGRSAAVCVWHRWYEPCAECDQRKVAKAITVLKIICIFL